MSLNSDTVVGSGCVQFPESHLMKPFSWYLYNLHLQWPLKWKEWSKLGYNCTSNHKWVIEGQGHRSRREYKRKEVLLKRMERKRVKWTENGKSNTEVEKRTIGQCWGHSWAQRYQTDIHALDGQGQVESQWDHKVPAEDQVITDNYN